MSLIFPGFSDLKNTLQTVILQLMLTVEFIVTLATPVVVGVIGNPVIVGILNFVKLTHVPSSEIIIEAVIKTTKVLLESSPFFIYSHFPSFA